MKEFEKLFTVEDIAQMTMLTTRTIRNYLKEGLLTGRKIGGQWRFTEKDIATLFENSSVEADMMNSRRQEVMDFIDGINTDIEGDIQICTIVDYYCSDMHMAKELSDRFCNIISEQKGNQAKFYYEYIEKEQKARYTFFGTPMFIKDAVIIMEEEWRKLNASLSKFTDRAKNYAEFRPSYPREAIDLILKVTGKKGITIADIGSGTGKMTSLLLERGIEVYAVEPNEDMRKEAELKLGTNPLFHSITGTAESTFLKASSVDAIICAEAYHWFDNEKTILEFKRLLKPNGHIFLLWNTFGNNPYNQVMDELFDKYCKKNANTVVSTPKEDLAKHLFGEGSYSEDVFDNTLNQTQEGLLGGSLSASYSPKPGTADYDGYVKGLKEVFEKYNKNGMIETKFKTVCYYGTV